MVEVSGSFTAYFTEYLQDRVCGGAFAGVVGSNSGMIWLKNAMVIPRHLPTHLKRLALGTTAAFGVTIGSVSFAQADYIYWTGASSSDWNDPGNWSSLVRVPGGGVLDTTAVVGSPVVENQPIINAPGVLGYLVRIGDAVAAASPAPLAGMLTIKDGGTLTLTRYMGVGYDDGTNGQLIVTGAGSALTITQANGLGTLYVASGSNSSGTADISAGASVLVDNLLDVAGAAGSSGLVTVDASTVGIGGYFVVGDGGDATLTVRNGSVVRSGTSQPSAGSLTTTDSIGAATGSVGLVTVSGAGSMLTSYNPLVVGGQSPAMMPYYAGYGLDAAIYFQGHGTLKIADGGVVESGVGVHTDPNFANVSYIGGTPLSGGVVTVTDPNSSWTVGGNLVVGAMGQGSLNIANSGSVSVANGVTIAEDAASIGTLNIGAEAGSAPVAPGTLIAPTVTLGEGASHIVFNHTDTSGNYEFASVITGGSATTSFVDVLSGTTVMTGVGSNYFGRTTIYDGAVLAAGAADVFSSNSDYIVQGAGMLDLRGGSQTVGGLANAGLINMGTGTAPGTILTVNGNYVGNGGTIVLNTFLGDDNSPTDKLVVNGSTSGATGLRIVNAGGLGAQTIGNGIEVVQVNGASNGQFSLTGRLVAGVYDYNLFQNGTNNTDGNWYLRSTIRPEVPTDTVVPAMASRLGFAMLGTFFERAGGIVNRVDENGNIVNSYADPSNSYAAIFDGSVNSGTTRYCGDDVEAPKSGLHRKEQPVPCNALLWGRVFGETGNAGSVGGAGAYSFGYGGFQAGVDLYHTTRDNAGLFVSAATMRSDVSNTAGQSAGRVGMDAYGVGGYWTHRVGSWYTDLVLLGNWYDNVHADSVAGQNFATQGWGLTASAETGYALRLGDGYSLVPQAQLVYQRTDIQGGADQFGRISFGATDEIYGRLGTRFAKLWLTNDSRTVSTWADVNVWHHFGADAKTTFTNLEGAFPTTMSAGLGDTWTEFALGISGQVTRNVSVFGNVSYNVALSQFGHSVTGRSGVRVAW